MRFVDGSDFQYFFQPLAPILYENCHNLRRVQVFHNNIKHYNNIKSYHETFGNIYGKKTKYNPLRLTLLLDSAFAGGESVLQLNENGSVQLGASFWCLVTAASSADSPLPNHQWQVTSLTSPQSHFVPNPCVSSSPIPLCVYPAVSWHFVQKDTVRNSIEGFTEIQTLDQLYGLPLLKGYQVWWARLSSHDPMLDQWLHCISGVFNVCWNNLHIIPSLWSEIIGL